MFPKLTIQSGYSLLLFLLIISLVGGDYFFNFQILGIEIYAYRVVLFGGFLFLLATKSILFFKGNYSKWVLLILVFWFLYGLFLLIWSPNLLLGIKELYYLVIGFLTYILLLSLKVKLTSFYDHLERYWLIGFIVLTIFLLVEFMTQYHFEGSYFEKLQGLGFYHEANLVPVFTFVNPNHLAIYFCFTITLSIYFILRGYNFLIHSLVILLSIRFLFLIGSRLSFLFLFGSFIFLILFYIFKFIRNTANVKFNWKILVALFFLGALNYCILFFIGDENTHKEVTRERTLVIAVDSFDSLPAKFGTADHIFPIEQKLKEKLWTGDTTKVQIENITGREFNSAKFFTDYTSNKGVPYLFILYFVFLLVGFIFYSFKFNGNNLLGVFFASTLILLGVFATNSFDRPNKKLQYSVLREVGSSKIAIKDIRIASIEAKTALALTKGQILAVHFIKSKKAELGFSDSSKALNVYKEQLSGDAIRKNLILNGLDYLKESNYIGIGPGAYIVYNQQKKNKHPIGTVYGAHNFVIEILSQYGVLVIGLLVIISGIIFFMITKSLFQKVWSNEHTFAVILFVCLFLLGNANSRFLSLPINWFIFSFIFIVSDELFARNKNNIGCLK